METQQNQAKLKIALIILSVLLIPGLSGCGEKGNTDNENGWKINKDVFYSAFLNAAVSSGGESVKYNMNLYLDDELLSGMEYGGAESFSKNLQYGTHKLKFEKDDDKAVFGTTYIFVGMEGQKIEVSATGHNRYIDISVTSYK